LTHRCRETTDVVDLLLSYREVPFGSLGFIS
jgi:hypothetical protein